MPDAVVFPGRFYGPTAPLLLYASDVAERRGAMVHRHDWSTEPPDSSDPDVEAWARIEAMSALNSVGGMPLVIGKSLGSNTAGLAAERSLPAVWLTPLLTMPWVAAALGQATAPFLLVGGTNDPTWDGALARRLSPHLLEVDGADHGMYVQGPLTDSIEVLKHVVVAIEEFLDTIAWPG
jgi:pimeloyl-ACP methyl ester carboxylesterase